VNTTTADEHIAAGYIAAVTQQPDDGARFTDACIIAACGDDPQLWAEAFCEIAERSGKIIGVEYLHWWFVHSMAAAAKSEKTIDDIYASMTQQNCAG
jgi:hypothetical protein